MIISFENIDYICFGEYDGIKFSNGSSKVLLLDKNKKFQSFDECKQIVANHHNVPLLRVSAHCGVLRS